MIYIYSISIKDNAKRYTLKNKYPSYIFYRYRCAMSPYACPAHVCKFLCKSKDTPRFFTRRIPSPRSILLECMQVKRLVTHELISPHPLPTWVSYLSEYSPLKFRPASFFDSSVSRTCLESGVSLAGTCWHSLSGASTNLQDQTFWRDTKTSLCRADRSDL